MIDRFVIYWLIGGCLIFGALVLLELRPAATDTATPNEVSIRPDPSAMHRQPSTQLDELLAVALARPLFSSTRRPPQAAANDSTDSDLADMRLTGIVTEPEHHLAIFAVKGATKPLRLTEGEAVSGWRIESITPTRFRSRFRRNPLPSPCLRRRSGFHPLWTLGGLRLAG